MFSSLAVALTICFVAVAIIVVGVVARARTDASVARVLYDTEHPVKTR